MIVVSVFGDGGYGVGLDCRVLGYLVESLVFFRFLVCGENFFC